MPLADTPILDQDINPLDTVDFNPQVSIDQEDEEVKTRRTTEASVIKAMDDGNTDFVTSYLEVEQARNMAGVTGTETRQTAIVSALENAIQTNQALGTDMLGANPVDPDLIVQAVSDVNEELREEGARQDAPYQILTNQFNDPTLVDEETRKALAVNAALGDQAHELVAEQGLWGLLGDIALDLIPFKMVIDMVQATGEYNPFEWENTIRDLIGQYQLMSPEEMLDRVPVLQARLLADGVPKFRVAAIISAIVDPSKEERVGTEFGIIGPISALLDIAVVSSLLRMARGAKTLANVPKLASQSGDTVSAAKINTTVLADATDEVAKIVGIDKMTAVNNATPLNVAKIDAAADNTMSGAVFNNLVAYKAALKGRLNVLEEGTSFIKEPSIMESAIPAAVERIDEVFAGHILRLAKEQKIVDVTRLDKTITSRGVTYDFIYRDNLAVEEDIGRFSRSFVQDDNGIWATMPEPTVLSKLLLSVKARAAGGFERAVFGETAQTDFLEAVQGAIRLDFADAVVRKEFSALLTEAVKPITGISANIVKRTRKIEEVAEVLTHGDEVGELGHVYTIGELRAGVLGTRLDPSQTEVYYNIQALVEGVANLRNTAQRRNYVERNIKTIFMEGKAVGFGGFELSSKDATAAIKKSKILTVWDAAQSKVVGIHELDDMEALYARGKRLVRLEENILREKKLHQWSLVDVQAIRELPSQVLHLKEGYIPRINPRGAWFVQVLSENSVDGVPITTRKAIRGFDTQRQAKEYSVVVEDLVLAGEKVEGTTFRTDSTVVFNREREIEQFATDSNQIGSAQGLIYGPRRSETLPFGPIEDNLRTPRLGAFESIGLYMENSKNFVTRNEWRMAMRATWENTARKLTGNPKVTYTETQGALENRILKESHDQIQEWSGFLHPSERMWDDMMQRLYEVTVNVRGKPGFTAERFHAMKHKDGAAALKTVAFHSLLGGLNPAQLIVQGSGSAVALSTNMFRPDKLATVVFKQNGIFAAGIGDLMEHPAAFNKLAIAFGWKPATLRKTMKLWKKSGLEDSTLMSADIEAAQAGFGMTAAGWRKAQTVSTLGFRHGELFNRRISFMTAVDELGGVSAVLGNAGLERQMLTRVSDFLLNLGRANRAWWQKGVFGVPTQFLQIMTKTAETYLGLNGGFTGWERAKLFMTQFMLYGAAALPAGAWLSRHYLNQTGWTQNDVNKPENKGKIALINGGSMDYLLNVYLGADVTMANRTSLLQGFDRAFMDFFEEEATMYDKVTGPSGGVAKRVWQKIEVMSPFFARYPFPDEFEDITQQDILDTVAFLAEDAGTLLASPFSTTSQINKYLDMTNMARLIDRRGGVIAGNPLEGDFSLSTRLMTIMGAKLNVLDQKWTLQQINENTDDYVEYQVDKLMYSFMRYFREVAAAQKAKRPLNQRIVEGYRRFNDVIKSSIGNQNIRERVEKQFADRVRGLDLKEDQLSRQQQEAYRNYLNELADEISSANIKVTPTR